MDTFLFTRVRTNGRPSITAVIHDNSAMYGTSGNARIAYLRNYGLSPSSSLNASNSLNTDKPSKSLPLSQEPARKQSDATKSDVTENTTHTGVTAPTNPANMEGHFTSDVRAPKSASELDRDAFQHDYQILATNGKQLVMRGFVLKYSISGWHHSLDLTLPDLSTAVASAFIASACDHPTDLWNEWAIRVYLVNGTLAGECTLQTRMVAEIDNAVNKMQETLSNEPWKAGLLHVLTGHEPRSAAERKCKETVVDPVPNCSVSTALPECSPDYSPPIDVMRAYERKINQCIDGLRQEWMSSH